MDKEDLEAIGLNAITIERKADGSLWIDDVDTSEYAEATDALIQKLGFNAPHAIIMLVEYLGSQCAMQDHVYSEKSGEMETFYLGLASRMLGVFYNDFRVTAAARFLPQKPSEIN